jgi:RNA polymerase sigma-70 factor (ECF subfamily)
VASQELSTLERIAQGDQSAVQDCIDRFGNLVWSLARRLSGNQSDAEDAMIARRRLIDRRRRQSRRPEEVSAPAPSEMYEDYRSDASDMLELGEEAQRARGAFGSLSTEQQRVLQLSLQFGLSHQRISEATGLPLGTVKTHARRGLLRIRQALDGANGDGQTGEGSEEATR